MGKESFFCRSNLFTTRIKLRYYFYNRWKFSLSSIVQWIEIYPEGQTYRYDNGQLHQYVDGEFVAYQAEAGSFLAGVNDALNTINGLASGSELISFYANDENMAYIQAHGGGNELAPDGINLIYLNQNLQGSEIPTTAGLQMSPFWLDTAHELAHRQDYIKNGQDEISGPNATWHINATYGTPIRKTEKYATTVENQLRTEARLPLRTHYTSQGQGGWEPTRILQQPYIGFGINFQTGQPYIPKIKIPRGR